MTIYNLGSINLDHVYRVRHFVRPGETLSSSGYRALLGGKGANQSIALARAGAEVRHIGAIGEADAWILQTLIEAGVETSAIARRQEASGHAIIQVTREAENAILLYPGANHSLTRSQIEQALVRGGSGDWLLLQNETNGLSDAMDLATERGVRVAFNPAPMVSRDIAPLLDRVDLLIVNEGEAMDLTGASTVAAAEARLHNDYPRLRILLTLGRDGVVYVTPEGRYRAPAFSVDAVDTTAAGDTFIGFCLADLAAGQAPEMALRRASAAAALCVTRAGAASAIPTLAEVETFLASNVP
ncbi:ribokinase [Marinobacter halodurans]|uniref:Ribokinase n=1 Tax=Marinobacter halodurans TaxID=2528979 RepID=A0ABY1ZN50_9GAMM|nr:ribokinase [Marinobacter halodurans]TBW57688.1 ribokinase [Marinobacter halodurans]